MMNLGQIALALAFTIATGCSSAGRESEVMPRKRHNVITRAELAANRFQTAHEAVAALRSNWLQSRGTDSFLKPSKVWVYLDSNRLGGVESLTSIAVSTVSYIEHFKGSEATTWWGVGHSAGVILVATHPVVANDQ